MKTAKEMFEELGFRLVRDSDYTVVYELFISAEKRETLYEITSMEFKKDGTGFILKGDLSFLGVSDKVFKAINKQVEELGWNEEEDNE